VVPPQEKIVLGMSITIRDKERLKKLLRFDKDFGKINDRTTEIYLLQVNVDVHAYRML
jgi:hypothetical protein